LRGNGSSIAAGATCDDELTARDGSIRTRSSLRRFEAVGHRGKDVTVLA